MTREAASLSKYDKRLLGQKADELDFIRDTLEKVYRLVDTLEYLNQNPLLKENLALKGGTAINLTIFNLPRLSIDIDLDYCNAASREEMSLNKINNLSREKKNMIPYLLNFTKANSSFYRL